MARAQACGRGCLLCHDSRASKGRGGPGRGGGGSGVCAPEEAKQVQECAPTGAPVPSRQEQRGGWAVTRGGWPRAQDLGSAWTLSLHHRPCWEDRIGGPGPGNVLNREGSARPILTPPGPVTMGEALLLSSQASIQGCSREQGRPAQHPCGAQGSRGGQREHGGSGGSGSSTPREG